MTLRELIDELEDHAETFGDRTEVRLACQPAWPFEYGIGDVVAIDPEDDDEEQTASVREPVVYIGEQSQIGYLPGEASRALGWGRR